MKRKFTKYPVTCSRNTHKTFEVQCIVNDIVDEEMSFYFYYEANSVEELEEELDNTYENIYDEDGEYLDSICVGDYAVSIEEVK